jgi:hypothetical protein
MKKISLIFITAFLFNAIWENLHSFLYENYMGGRITEFILLRATLVDATIITIITMPFILHPLIKKKSWIILPLGFILSAGIERWAVSIGRWAYNSYMPIIPLFAVGLSPAIQLGLLGYLSFRVEEYLSSHSLFYNK